MMPRSRIVRGEEAARGTPVLGPAPPAPHKRRMAREELEARLTGERVVQDAHTQAQAILAEARQQATAAVAAAERDARTKADVELTSRWVALRQAEGRRMGSDTERVVSIAVMLAERLVGATLQVDPTMIGSLANVVIAEARGVRRAVIHAHPTDAEQLRGQLAIAGVDQASFSVESDDSMERGSLRLQTDIGVIDAQLRGRLDRLSVALRDALGAG